MNPATVDVEYGLPVRCAWPGDSFGELALLQPHSLRTATVVAGASNIPSRRSTTASIVVPRNTADSVASVTSAALELPQSTFDDACATGGHAGEPGSRVADGAGGAEGAADGEGHRAAATAAIEKYGIGPGAVRTIAGTMSLHLQLEERLAFLSRFEVRLPNFLLLVPRSRHSWASFVDTHLPSSSLKACRKGPVERRCSSACRVIA